MLDLALDDGKRGDSVDPDDLTAFLSDLNGALETYPFGPETRVFKVGGKIFSIDRPDQEKPTITVKALPENVPRLILSVTGIRPGYHMNKRHWVTVDLGAVPPDHVRELIVESHAIVVHSLPRRLRLGLEG